MCYTADFTETFSHKHSFTVLCLNTNGTSFCGLELKGEPKESCITKITWIVWKLELDLSSFHIFFSFKHNGNFYSINSQSVKERKKEGRMGNIWYNSQVSMFSLTLEKTLLQISKIVKSERREEFKTLENTLVHIPAKSWVTWMIPFSCLLFKSEAVQIRWQVT